MNPLNVLALIFGRRRKRARLTPASLLDNDNPEGWVSLAAAAGGRSEPAAPPAPSPNMEVLRSNQARNKAQRHQMENELRRLTLRRTGRKSSARRPATLLPCQSANGPIEPAHPPANSRRASNAAKC